MDAKRPKWIQARLRLETRQKLEECRISLMRGVDKGSRDCQADARNGEVPGIDWIIQQLIREYQGHLAR